MKAFKYECTIRGHEADVRGLCPTSNPPNSFLSSSRDQTAKLWVPESNSTGFQQQQVFKGHKNFVSCIAVMNAANEIYPDGLIFTGSNDHNIHVYLPGASEPIMVLAGHSNSVSSLAVGKFGTLVSGSWDKSARLWLMDTSAMNEGKCAMVMQGHIAAVWDVIIMPEQQGLVITAAADKTIRSWRTGKCLNVFKGHTDCVRGLAALSSEQFLSCSNDATIRRWSIDGQCLQTYYGHSNFVYSVTVLNDGQEFVTSSEDRSVKVWRVNETNPTQSIATPAQSVWDVVTLENDDIAFGSSDATIRIFTRSHDRAATLEECSAYEKELSNSRISQEGNQLGDLAVNDLPGREALEKQGEKDGQTLMLRHDAVVEAYQWNAADGKWMKVGDVVGSNATGKKTMYQGKEYDYVFTIDNEDGKPPLNLPYNLTEDPWFAAQKFIDDQNLSQAHLDTIANFIMDNTKGAEIGYGKPSEYADPFTGGGRYQPNASESTSTEGGADPYTGAGRYRPDSNGTQGPQGGIDPFTGGGRYRPTGGEEGANWGNPSAPLNDQMLDPSRYVPGDDDETMQVDDVIKKNTYFPKTGYILFESCNVNAMLGKLREFGEKSGNDVSESDIECFKRFTEVTTTPSASDVEFLWKALHWKEEFVFPVLDLLRFSISCQPYVTQQICHDRAKDLLLILLSHIRGTSPLVPTNRLISIRILNNLFKTLDGDAFILAGCVEIIDAVCSFLPNDQTPVAGNNKNIQVASATLFLNLSVLIQAKSTSTPSIADMCRKVSIRCIDAILQHLSNPQALVAEALFRHLVALGTLVFDDKVALQKACSLNALSVVNKASSVHSSTPKISECSQFLVQILK
uniref:phospholipase A-2-activating protein n=1 Tax=Ciona intestinalis TaxID=7719 RepID=UPI000180D139|nr:phospholipase A-2-activating protein [Ciona intestinalis]|eukprot:XP_002128410.1 phospholipase A-2-activating protein [Ciona intestinalis]